MQFSLSSKGQLSGRQGGPSNQQEGKSIRGNESSSLAAGLDANVLFGSDRYDVAQPGTFTAL